MNTNVTSDKLKNRKKVKNSITKNNNTTKNEIPTKKLNANELNKLKNLEPPKNFYYPYCPSFSVAFKFILFCRLLAAIFTVITDCDETFNYWEPTHYLHYGYGLQTWEYSPKYSIRSWAYILIHTLISKVLSIPAHNKYQLFFFIRMVFATVSSYCETILYQAIVNYTNPYIAQFFLFGIIYSAGMSISSVGIFKKRTFYVIFFYALGGLLGWPFSAVLVFPFVFEDILLPSIKKGNKIINKKFRINDTILKIKDIIVSGILSICIILGPMMLIDFIYYKKWTVVPLNIVLYNVFSSDKGPNIYGTEPWHYYLFNGFLNFNLLFLLALLSIPLLAFEILISKRPHLFSKMSNSLLLMKLVPMYLWIIIFTAQPHKEERFLFVIYPLIIFNASKNGKKLGRILIALLLAIYSVLSISRILSLYINYSAPLKVYGYLNSENMLKELNSYGHNVTICVGKEWYHFPTHYFMPNSTRIGFVKSKFDGLLPGYFKEGKDHVGTWVIPEGMNDLNQEEFDKYVDIKECSYMVDLYVEENDSNKDKKLIEPNYISQTDKWEKVVCKSFINKNKSHGLLRPFFFPKFVRNLISKPGLVYNDYCLLRRVGIYHPINEDSKGKED
ncbi:glycosyltransferase family 22 protein [Piromyces sp. E2]|nr:glycosyltransferase family 22 protein [Piromyces sp. E2]|eukprot:OUM65604.1 glycosyltransferase family 22 protein [Piromyces sp. E2]